MCARAHGPAASSLFLSEELELSVEAGKAALGVAFSSSSHQSHLRTSAAKFVNIMVHRKITVLAKVLTDLSV